MWGRRTEPLPRGHVGQTVAIKETYGGQVFTVVRMEPLMGRKRLISTFYYSAKDEHGFDLMASEDMIDWAKSP